MVNRLLCLVLLLATSSTVAAQGPLLWDLTEDFAGGTDLARNLRLSGGVAVVVGNGGQPLDGTDEDDLVIQALRRPTGGVQWSDRAFLSLGNVQNVFVATSQHRAYAVGTLNQPGDPRNAILVRGYDVFTGSLLWQNTWYPSDQIDAAQPTAVAATPTRVVVAGYAGNTTRDGLAAVIRAYDPLTGAVLWEAREEQGGMSVSPWTIIANARRVIVAGSIAPNGTSSDATLFVRAYDAGSGTLEWQMNRQSVTPFKTALASGRLVIAGQQSSSGTSPKTYLAAMSANSGAVLWEDTKPVPGLFRDIAVKDGRIVGAIGSFPIATVRAYDLLTGNIEWESQPALPVGTVGSFFTIGQTSDAVFVAGQVGTDAPGGPASFWVQAYDAGSGALLWDDRSHPGTTAAAVDLAVGKLRVFVAGYTQSAGNADWVIRTYDNRTDAFLTAP